MGPTDERARHAFLHRIYVAHINGVTYRPIAYRFDVSLEPVPALIEEYVDNYPTEAVAAYRRYGRDPDRYKDFTDVDG